MNFVRRARLFSFEAYFRLSTPLQASTHEQYKQRFSVFSTYICRWFKKSVMMYISENGNCVETLRSEL